MAAGYTFGDLNGSFSNLGHIYRNGGFNDEEKFVLIRNAFMKPLELAKTPICEGAQTCTDLFRAIVDFCSSCCVF